MKKILILIEIVFLAIVIVSLSPMIIKYPKTVPLVKGGLADDTITHFYSGFPIPYMHRTNLGMNIDFNRYIYWADVILLTGGIYVALLAIKRKKIDGNR